MRREQVFNLRMIRRRWSHYGGMGNDRSPDDYTDYGCRTLLHAAWRDIDTLLELLDEQGTALAQARHGRPSWHGAHDD